MGENVQDKHALGSIIDPGNQSIFVGVDIEHGPATHDIRMREVLPHIGQRAPVRTLGDPIPVHQGDQSIPAPFGKLENGWLANHPHDLSLQNVNLRVNDHGRPKGKGLQTPEVYGAEIWNRSFTSHFPLSPFRATPRITPPLPSSPFITNLRK